MAQGEIPTAVYLTLVNGLDKNNTENDRDSDNLYRHKIAAPLSALVLSTCVQEWLINEKWRASYSGCSFWVAALALEVKVHRMARLGHGSRG